MPGGDPLCLVLDGAGVGVDPDPGRRAFGGRVDVTLDDGTELESDVLLMATVLPSIDSR